MRRSQAIICDGLYRRYICRAFYKDSLWLGYLNDGQFFCSIAIKDIIVFHATHYDLLSDVKNEHTWIPYNVKDPISEFAGASGHIANGIQMYSFRIRINGQHYCGYVANRVAFVPYGKVIISNIKRGEIIIVPRL